MSFSSDVPDKTPLAPLDLSSRKESPDSPSTPPMLPVPKRSNILKSPAPSFAESFATALTSPVDDSDDTSRLNPPSLAPPQSLRKSISVDSFAQYNRDSPRSIRGQGASPSSPPRSPVYGTPVDSQSRLEKLPWAGGRHRGESLSSVHHSVRQLDSDGDRYDPLSAATTERYRRASLKTHDPSKPSVRGGDLPLPSRSHNNSISTIGSTLSIPEGVPASSTSSSRAPSLKRAAGAGQSRSRSGSVGFNPSKRINPINTQSLNLTPRTKDIVLVVLGTTGCGKSTVIRKGLSGSGLEEAQVISESPKYTRRFGSCLVGLPEFPGSEPSHTLQVIKGEVESTHTGPAEWPQGFPSIDGVVLCYDSSKRSSYQPIESLLQGYRAMGLPVLVLGCKADLEDKGEVDPSDAVAMLKKYDTGLVQVSVLDAALKEKMTKSFDYLLKAIFRQRASSGRAIDNRNPASPAILTKSDSLERVWSNSPTLSSSNLPHAPMSARLPDASALGVDNSASTIPDILTADHSRLTSKPSDITPANRNGSASTLSVASRPIHQLPGGIKPALSTSSDQTTVAQYTPGPPSTTSLDMHDLDSSTVHTNGTANSEETRIEPQHSPGVQEDPFQQAVEDLKNGVKREPKFVQWAKLDELLDKLLFLSVSGDDPTYATHFLLTYRRFATPRSLLLAMQKRMRQLDNPSGDPMFACFAQMRICHLLEIWVRDYPNDFAVKGTLGALNALIKSIISKTHLLHYGSDFLPFLEQLPGLVEQDSAWALRADISDNDSDDYNEDEEDEETRAEAEETEIEDDASSATPSKVAFPSRERKSSLPLPKALLSPQPTVVPHTQDPSPKQLLKDLQKLAGEVLLTDSEEIAQEITRQCAEMFLLIKPRDWLHFTFVSKKGEGEPITAYNAISNHLADWVVSLILCHDRPRARVRMIEKFVDIAHKIRQMNNYSGLRAFVAGINIAASDATLEAFRSRSPEAAKNLMSWDVLLRQIRSHRAYRMALRNSKGGCIPALEVHIQDLIKAHEGNPDKKDDDPSLIHWGKFNMMGRFICTVTQCQAQCRNSDDYDFPERIATAELFDKRPVMSPELQETLLNAQDEFEDGTVAPTSQKRDINKLRKLFFW